MDYKSKILAAVDYIEDNFSDADLLENVSAHVGLSAYHFHRVFAGMLGESVMEYARKRRLSEAAVQLQGSTRPIIEIAMDSRFDSQESFTRAFKKMFGITPGAYRKSRQS
ncbi:MAG TPA: AraC family transcriptional regulator, partial [Chroococcales cyanobacterium]